MILVTRNASLWINKYFLESSEVSYSGNLKEIVEGWQVDPCIKLHNEALRSEAETTTEAEPTNVNVTHKEQRKPMEYYIGVVGRTKI